MKRHRITALLAACLLLLASCAEGVTGNSSVADFSEVSQSLDVSEIPEGEISSDIKFADTSSFDFNFSSRDKENDLSDENAKIALDKGKYLEITEEGSYIFEGEISNKYIFVNAPDDAKIQLYFNDATINNPNGPAIYIAEADKVFITLAKDSENSFSDGNSYLLTDSKSEIDAAVFSRADLTINGEGGLTVNGNYKHGIVSKDDLVISSATLNVTAKNVALCGKDCVKIRKSNLNLTAGSDGIRSDNDTDEDRGYIYIESGKIGISAANDGIQAQRVIKIADGEFNIASGGGSRQTSADAGESYKGIKSSSDVLIYGGKFNIDSLDDAIHSNATVGIFGGVFAVTTSDDAFHADEDLSISGGEISASRCFEGLEASRIFVSGGKISIGATDDGINAAGGDGSTENNPIINGRPSGNGFGGDKFGKGIGEINLSGGYIIIDAKGDGIDSNGSITLSGGIVLVNGPTNNGNGALDCDGSAKVTGGVLVAVGAAGMAGSFKEAENQGAIFTSFAYRSGGTNIALCDGNGKALVVFKPTKDYQCAVITTPDIKQGESYKLYAAVEVSDTDGNGFAQNISCSGGTHIEDITMTSLIYGTAGGGGFGGPGFGGPGGGPGGGDHGGGPGGRPGRP